ncbi:MAG TPA: 2-dehydro-3-deoxy-D-gluconate 5-dehydrogenase KduD [Acidimicrobiia bacterium]|jgi:2-deoxy-D-gluconate 3-dehydrogenase
MAHIIDLSGKTALVTGARRGLGRAIAVGLAEAGADVIGVSAAQEESGSEVEQLVEGMGRAFIGRRCDLSDRRALYELLAWLADERRQVDILVNNAGVISRHPAAEHGDEQWDRVVEVNLSSPFILARELGKQMVERRSGKIIFTASLLSFQGGITVPSYTASKSAIAGLTRALANEWANQGVNVNAIAPGYMATDNTEALRHDPVRSRAILERIPAGRWGMAEDVAGAAVFLASGSADYIHGTVLTVDGGWMAR